MKKIGLWLLLLLTLLPIGVRAVEDEEQVEKSKVKVYVFVAGGCPYCKDEMDYLQSLDSYNEKFEIVVKNLFVDHIDWAPDVDYDLGVKVAKAFKKAGFKDAKAKGTPFVIISDLYAATAFNDALEPYIEQAYEEGDKDVVGCFERGEENCLEGIAEKTLSTKGVIILSCSLVVLMTGIIGAGIYMNKKTSK